MWVYTHPDCLQHDPGPGHPESPARLSAVTAALHQALPRLRWVEAPLATRAQLARVHARGLIATVLDTVTTTPLRLDPDTVLSPDSAHAALRACGAGIAAVDAVLGDRTRQAFCAVRPPGHHATGTTAMGFCLFNSVAVAAAHALDEHSLRRVAILDFDVHHGNGTQAIFEQSPEVLFVSSHQMPLYPGTGYAEEVGCGNILNLPLPPHAGSREFRQAWSQLGLPALHAFDPDLIVVSAGFDAHEMDPLGQLRLQDEDFRWITRAICDSAEKACAGRVISVLEGGYNLEALASASRAHVEALAGVRV
jgi:acetoin utilization deacetylase AcuC-like enzyme